MEVLACGHAAHEGGRLICAHLVGEQADDLDKAWVLRGIGIEYDLCCAACAEGEVMPQLIVACEGCVENADTSAIKIVGAPEILYRCEPFDATLRRTRLPAPDCLLAPVHDLPGVWLLLSGDQLMRWNADTGEVEAQWTVVLPNVEPAGAGRLAATLHLIAAPGGEFAAIVVNRQRHGIVINMFNGRQTMSLERDAYHVEQTRFPAAFARLGGQLLLIHATDWNRVDISDPATGACITPRSFEPVEGRRFPKHYLDYFYGALHPSPDGELIVADGWVWHPIGIPRSWNLRHWRYDNVFEPEDGPSVLNLRYIDYYWNSALCWLDNTTVALAGIGSDDLAMIAGVELIDVLSGELRYRFAGPRGELFAGAERLFSAEPDGMRIWDPVTGEQIGFLPDFTPSHHHRASNELVVAERDELVRWRLD